MLPDSINHRHSIRYVTFRVFIVFCVLCGGGLYLLFVFYFSDDVFGV